MKILQIVDIPWYSGITGYALELSKGLSKRGHKIFFAGVKNKLPLKLAGESGFETINICSRKNPFVPGSVIRLKNLIEKENIDIVNAHTGKGHFLAYLTMLLSGKKFAIVRTKSDAMYPKKSFLYKKTEKIITASEFIKKRYLEIGLNPKKVITIYQGIHIPNLQSPISNLQSPKVGIVGRLDPVKGHKYFLEAASLVLKKFPDAKFLIAGKEVNIKYKELKLLAGKLGIEKSVEFLGYVKDVYEIMSECSVGVIASTGSEAVSRVLLEWMVSGVPVAATAVGCIPEILDKQFLSKPASAESLCKNILYFLDNPRNMEISGENNRKTVESRFNLDRFILQAEKVYNEAVANTTH